MVQVVTGDSQEEVLIFRYKQTDTHFIIICISSSASSLWSESSSGVNIIDHAHTEGTTISCRILIKQSGGEKSLDTLDVVNLWKKKSLRGKRETWRAQSTYVQNEEQRHQVQFQVYAHYIYT